MALVHVDIDLDDIPTNELISELGRRHKRSGDELLTLKAKDLINLLEDMGCLQRIITQLRDWDNEPIPNLYRLREWREACIESAHSKGNN